MYITYIVDKVIKRSNLGNMIVIERLLPAFAAIDWKNNDDRYYDLMEIILSDLPDDEVEKVLLMK